MTFRDWFVEEMKRRGLSDQAAAIRIGVTESGVKAWRRGTRPSWDNAGKIARAFGVEPSFVRSMLGYREEGEFSPVEARSPEEVELLEAYRQTDDRGRRSILVVARSMRETADAEAASEA